jgi:hypothetical protein
MKTISNFLSDNSGGMSSMRLIMAVWFLGALVLWMLVSFQKAEIQPMPESIITLLGIVLSGKVVQRFGEKQEAPPV